MRTLMWKLICGLFVCLALVGCAGSEDEAELADILTPDEIAEDIEKSGDPGEDLNEAPLDPEVQIAESEDDRENGETNDSEQERRAEEVADSEEEEERLPEVVKTHPKKIEVDPSLPSFLQSHASKSPFVVVISRSKQRVYWIEKGKLTNQYLISTGDRGYTTPDGTFTITRMHARYVSKKYKARMDDAIFFNGGIAIHATYGSNIRKLGPRKDLKGHGYSHGCVRQSPENADLLYQRVKFHGAKNVTIVVQY